MSAVVTVELRARFARRLSELYGREVPAYNTLVDVAHGVTAASWSGTGRPPNVWAPSIV